jgi:catechol 2,3-dioxygenase-like lactoylglutathione lyase family enzyme
VTDHLHLRSPDPTAAGKFYVEALGAAQVSAGIVGESFRVVVDLGGLRLLIDQVPESIARPPAPPFLGIEHIGLRVENLDDAAAELRQRGTKFVVEPKQARPGVKIAFIEGPDDVRIELLERSDP